MLHTTHVSNQSSSQVSIAHKSCNQQCTFTMKPAAPNMLPSFNLLSWHQYALASVQKHAAATRCSCLVADTDCIQQTPIRMAKHCLGWALAPTMHQKNYRKTPHLHVTFCGHKLDELCVDGLQVQPTGSRACCSLGLHLFTLESLLLTRKQLAMFGTPDRTAPLLSRAKASTYAPSWQLAPRNLPSAACLT